MDEAPVQKKRRRWGRRIGLSLLGLIVIVVMGHAIWGWWEERALNKAITALRARGEPMSIEELLNRPVAEEDNAVILLLEGAESIDEKSVAWQEFDTLTLGLPLTEKELAAVKRVMQDNRSALAKLREARGKKGVAWQVDPSAPSLSHIEGLDEQKPLANLAAEAILLAHQEGNDREAVALVRDLLAQSNALERMPAGIIPHLVGIGVLGRACDRIFEIAADVRVGGKQGEVAPEELKKVIDELSDESSTTAGLRLAMQVERIHEVKAAQSLSNLSSARDEQQRKGMAVMEYVGWPFLRRDGRLLLEDTTGLMKAAQESPDCPVFLEKTRERVEQMRKLRQGTAHLAMALLAGMHDHSVEVTFRAITARRLAAVALAVRLYQFEHEGRLPAKLEELVPKYFPAVPMDGLARGKRIGFVADAQRPQVYSVGENGTDEGGSDAPRRKGFDGGRWSEEDLVVDLKRRERKKLD